MTDRNTQALRASAQTFPGDTPTALLLRAHDWNNSSLGEIGGWPQPLRLAVTLMQDSAIPMWLAWGKRLGMVYNEAYAAILGDKHPQALGSPLDEVWAEIWPDVGPLVATALSGQAVYREDMPLRVRRGGRSQLTWFTFSYTPLRDDEGAVRGLLCNVWETTEKVLTHARLSENESNTRALVEAAAQLENKRRQEEADAALLHAQKNETEERLRLAALATNDAIWDWHLSTGHVIWNRALGSLFGHPHEETSADWWIEHIHPDDRQRIDHSIHAVIDGGGSAWTDEYRFRRVDGSYADIFDRGSILRDADGQAIRMIGAMLDLSDSKAAALALRESERQFQTLFESIDEGFCVIEFLDGPEGPLSDYIHIAANPAYLANAGIADVVGQRVREMVPAEADGWVATYREVLLTGQPIRFERELVKTGRFLELSALRVEPAERRQVAVLFQDVTKRHRAELALRELNESLERRVASEVAERLKTEEALYQSQKMETIGKLTGGVAHDFNNLLQVIAGNLHLLTKSVAGNGRAERQVANALAGVSRGAKLSSQLLAFARKQPLEPRVVNPGRLVYGMEDLLRRSLGEEIETETVISGGLWNAAIDPAQLENAVLNLAINARDAMNGNGRLTIEVGNAYLDDLYASAHPDVTAGQYVVLAVSDTGTGMPADVVAQAFEPFFSTKPEGKGTGLGLSMVYGFVKQSGGHVKIYSEVGQGTTIKLYLPRSLEKVEVLPVVDFEPVAGGTETILVAEDDDEVRATVIEILGDLGYRILKANDAASALAIVESGVQIDLLFTDVVMPGTLRSPELARRARELLPDIAVLFTSGYTENAIVHGGRLDAGVDLIGKPYTQEALARKVRAVLSTQRQRNLEARRGTSTEPVATDSDGVKWSVLLVEDDELICSSSAELMRDLGYHVVETHSAEEALDALQHTVFDVLVTDLGLPRMSGEELACRARQMAPALRVVFATGHEDYRSELPGATLLVKPYDFKGVEDALRAVTSPAA